MALNESGESEEMEAAQEAISQLFDHMGILRVVCVDDEYAKSINVEDAIEPTHK